MTGLIYQVYLRFLLFRVPPFLKRLPPVVVFFFDLKIVELKFVGYFSLYAASASSNLPDKSFNNISSYE